jgi:hypothetical protein
MSAFLADLCAFRQIVWCLAIVPAVQYRHDPAKADLMRRFGIHTRSTLDFEEMP